MPPDPSRPSEPSETLNSFADLFGGDDPAPIDGFPASSRRRRRWPGIVAAAVVLVLFAGAGLYGAYTLTARTPAPTVATRVPVAAQPEPSRIDLPGTGVYAVRARGAAEYFGAGASNSTEKGLSLSADAGQRRPIASITKVITALVVLDAHPLDGPDDAGPTLVFSRADHALYDAYYVRNATIERMPTGSSMSLRDALQMMLIVSASNYADAVARWAFGGTGGFLRATQDWLDAHDLRDTTIVEPTGIDPRNTSTPDDLVRIARLAMRDPALAEIVAMPELDVPGFSGENTNGLLGKNGIRGLKTGTLNSSGANLLFSARLEVGAGEPLEITGALLGGSSRGEVEREVLALLDSIRDGFPTITVAAAGNRVGTATTPWGASADIVLETDAALRIWSDTPVTGVLGDVRIADGRIGEQVGDATFTAGPRTVTVPVVLDGDLEEPDAWWRLTHPFDLAGWPE